MQNATLKTALSIKDQPISLRPRERLAKLGPQILTTMELVTLVLGSGNKQATVQTLARKVETKLVAGQKIRLEDLTTIKGIGLAKACQIIAAVELVERLRPAGNELVVDSLDKVLSLVNELRFLPKEQMVGIYLDARMKVILKETVAVGALNQAVIAPRDIFSLIKNYPIAHLILAHNHPSGDPTPSSEDIDFTVSMKNAGDLLGVSLLDHVIVARDRQYSFKQAGRLF